MTRQRTATRAWHKPRCNGCGRPIETTRDAIAAWTSYTVEQTHEERTHTPIIVCRERCARKLARKTLWGMISVDKFRAAPMEAIVIAMRRHAEIEAERVVWHAWLSVVLGLPFGELTPFVERDAAGALLDHVPDLNEVIGEIGDEP